MHNIGMNIHLIRLYLKRIVILMKSAFIFIYFFQISETFKITNWFNKNEFYGFLIYHLALTPTLTHMGSVTNYSCITNCSCNLEIRSKLLSEAKLRVKENI